MWSAVFLLRLPRKIRRRVEWLDRRVRPEIERMVRMAAHGALARAHPLRAKALPEGDHVREAVEEVRALFNDVAPRRPDDRGR